MRTPPSPTFADYHDSFRSRTPSSPLAAAALVSGTPCADEPLACDDVALVAGPFFQPLDHPTRELAEANGAAEAGVCAVQHAGLISSERTKDHANQ